MSQSKTGRNDPCPCGSGKKYKKCCIDKLIIPDELSDTKLGEYLELFDMISQYGAINIDPPSQKTTGLPAGQAGFVRGYLFI